MDYRVAVDVPGTYRVAMNTDRRRYGGHERIQEDNGVYFTNKGEWCARGHSLQVYIPSRTALVLYRE